MKIWYVICIWLCFYSISNLLKENGEIVYKLTNKIGPTNYLICFNLKEVDTLTNITTVDLQKLNKVVNDYFSIRFNKSNKWFKKYNSRMFKKLVLNPIESKDYFIFDHKFCFSQEDRNIYYIYFLYFFFENFEYYLFKKDTYDLFKLNNYFDEVDQLVIINKQYPHSNCTKNYSKFKCLNDCFKKEKKLLKYFYNGNENGILYLKYEYNQTIKKEEYDCLSECKRDDCKLVHFVSSDLQSSKTKAFVASFFISKSEFLVELLGLICLVENISFYQLLSKLFKLLKPKVKKINKIKLFRRVIKITKPERYLHILKIFILLISIGCFIYYFIIKFKTINTLLNNPSKSEAKTHLLEPEKMNLVFCDEVYKYLKEHSQYTDDGYIRNNMTLLQLEKATDSVFDDIIDKIYLKFQNEIIEIEYIRKPKVLFKSLYMYFTYSLLRCFHIEANPTEPKYQSLLATSKLIVKFKSSASDLYLLPEEERFNLKSYQHDNSYDFLKKVKKRANTIMHRRCVDYDKEYSDCNSKQNCIDRCVNKKFIEIYKNISIYSIVDKDHFTKEQWSNSFPNGNFSIFKKTEQECVKEFKDDCNKVEFENDKINQENYVSEIKQIPLYYNVISEIEEEASFYKLLVDLLNMQSILFGQNVLKSLLIIYCLLNTKYQLRNNKYHFYFIYLICLFGFIYHTLFIFDVLLNQDLIHYNYYSLESSIKMPGIIFCFDLTKVKINKNIKLNENYLSELSKEISIERVFKNITYLNKSNKWITLDSNYSESKVKTFYFLDKKCFKIKHKIEYSRDQFHLLDNKEVLKVNFNNISNQSDLTIHFFTKIDNKMQFSKIEKLIFNETFRPAYTSNQEITELNKNDEFNKIKSVLLLLFQDDNNLNDANLYLINLIKKFDIEYNLRTLYIPSKKEGNSNEEIDEDLFKQLFKQNRNVDDESPTSSKTVRYFITTNVKENALTDNQNDSDFKFELNFLKNVIKYTYKISLTKIILNMLTILSFWSDLCILDLHVYAYYAYYKIKLIFISTYRLLIRIDIYLYRYAYCYK